MPADGASCVLTVNVFTANSPPRASPSSLNRCPKMPSEAPSLLCQATTKSQFGRQATAGNCCCPVVVGVDLELGRLGLADGVVDSRDDTELRAVLADAVPRDDDAAVGRHRRRRMGLVLLLCRC